MWLGVLHHVCGENEWADGECTHGPLVSTENGKAFLEMDSKPHKAVRDIVADRTWLKTLAFYVKFRYVKSQVIRPCEMQRNSLKVNVIPKCILYPL